MRIEQMNEEMVQALIETLPAEITVIGANDEVVGWNKHETRLFHRPMTAMGLNFGQCCSEASPPLVEKIVEEMRTGRRDTARFWIDLAVPNDAKKHKILIEFYALPTPPASTSAAWNARRTSSTSASSRGRRSCWIRRARGG